MPQTHLSEGYTLSNSSNAVNSLSCRLTHTFQMLCSPESVSLQSKYENNELDCGRMVVIRFSWRATGAQAVTIVNFLNEDKWQPVPLTLLVDMRYNVTQRLTTMDGQQVRQIGVVVQCAHFEDLTLLSLVQYRPT